MDLAVRRQRGVYFTPFELASYVVRSAEVLCRRHLGRGLDSCTVLDPALGEGAFARAVGEVAPKARAIAWEILPDLARAARRALPGLDVRQGDALGQIPEFDGPVVVVGNPPWKGHSANAGAIADLMRDYASAGERNPKWLGDDCLRFLRWAHETVLRAGSGVVALVLNHAFVRGVTHAGLRARLRADFDEIHVLDLHGSHLRPETPPHGGVDENVFAVRPGTAVLLVVRSRRPPRGPARTFHADLWGQRSAKLAWLAAHDASTTPWRLLPVEEASAPFCPIRRDPAYARWPRLGDLFSVWSVGMVSGRDAAAYAEDRSDLLRRHPGLEPDEIFSALYRAGEARWTAFSLHVRPRIKVMRHLLAPGARAIVALRQGGPAVWPRAIEVDRPIDNCLLSTQSTARAYAFPLQLADGRANLDPALLGLDCPVAAFEHVRATLGDPRFWRAHADELLYDFPRIPPATGQAAGQEES